MQQCPSIGWRISKEWYEFISVFEVLRLANISLIEKDLVGENREVQKTPRSLSEKFNEVVTVLYMLFARGTAGGLFVVYIPGRETRVVTVVVTSKFNIVENRVKAERWVKL